MKISFQQYFQCFDYIVVEKHARLSVDVTGEDSKNLYFVEDSAVVNVYSSWDKLYLKNIYQRKVNVVDKQARLSTDVTGNT
jgi:hypothetical protein